MRTTLLTLLITLLLTPALLAEDWVTLSEPGQGPEVQIAPASIESKGDDLAACVINVGGGHLKLELKKDKQIRTVEYGIWAFGKWQPRNPINGEFEPLQPHMMNVYDYVFNNKKEPAGADPFKD